MNQGQLSQFRHSYSKVLVRAWMDPDFMKQLASDPKAALKSADLSVQPDANVTVDTSGSTQNQDFGKEVAAWEKGQETGNYTLYVPTQPQLGKATPDPALAADSYCCCCCPCCTCT